MLVSKPTHGGGAPLGIDLEAGIATIRIPRPAPKAAAEDPGQDEQPVTGPAQLAQADEDLNDEA